MAAILVGRWRATACIKKLVHATIAYSSASQIVKVQVLFDLRTCIGRWCTLHQQQKYDN